MWCCHDGKSTGQWAFFMSPQSTLPTVAEGAVAEFVAVSLPLFLITGGANLHLLHSGFWVQLGAANPRTF